MIELPLSTPTIEDSTHNVLPRVILNHFSNEFDSLPLYARDIIEPKYPQKRKKEVPKKKNMNLTLKLQDQSM